MGVAQELDFQSQNSGSLIRTLRVARRTALEDEENRQKMLQHLKMCEWPQILALLEDGVTVEAETPDVCAFVSCVMHREPNDTPHLDLCGVVCFSVLCFHCIPGAHGGDNSCRARSVRCSSFNCMCCFCTLLLAVVADAPGFGDLCFVSFRFVLLVVLLVLRCTLQPRQIRRDFCAPGTVWRGIPGLLPGHHGLGA